MSDDTTSNSQNSGEPTGPEGRAVAVSAYVDGEATPDEVRVVESDAALLADVRRLRALKAGVGDVPQLSPGHRDRLLADALAEFDTRHSSSVTAPPRPARSGGGRWLAVAAAVVAVVATAGLAVSLVVTSGSDDGGPNAGDSYASPTDAEENPLNQSPETAGDAGTSEVSDDEGPTAEAPGDDGALPEAEPTSTGTRASADQADSLQELADDRAMIDWVLKVQDGELTPDGQGDVVCDREVMGAATYRGDEVVVAIEDDLVVARDTDTCGEVLSTDAP